MNLRSWITAFRVPHLWAQVQLIRDVETFVRVQFLYAAFESGLLAALARPATRDGLIAALGVQRPELLDALLALGVRLKELSYRDGAYRIRGRRSRALATGDGDAPAAMIQELVTYHASVYQQLSARLRGAPSGDYLEEYGGLIARSSRVLEPFQANFVRAVVGRSAPLRLLEVGCGSGVYLRHAVEANASVTGIAIDMAPEVIEQARANLAAWGIGDRFDVLLADIRQPPPEITAPFDVISLYNNIYYFTPEERPGLLRTIRALLAPTGTFALVTMVPGNSIAALDLDLALRSTVGNTALPTVDEVTSLLKETGFAAVQTTKLLPTEPFYGFLAHI